MFHIFLSTFRFLDVTHPTDPFYAELPNPLLPSYEMGLALLRTTVSVPIITCFPVYHFLLNTLNLYCLVVFVFCFIEINVFEYKVPELDVKWVGDIF